MKYLKTRFACLLCILLLTSCSSIEPIIVLEDQTLPPSYPNYFGQKPDLASLQEIHQLSPQQEENFLEYFNNPIHESIEPHRRLYNYLFNSVNNFQYEGETYTATETLELNSGDCMSLAILTTALATLANLDISYQLIDTLPVYGLSGSVVQKGVHISSLIYKPLPTEITEFEIREGIKIDYFPTERGRFISNISNPEYIAMYYRNIAARAIGEQNYPRAYWFTLESMKYDSINTNALNMMAVIYSRVNEPVIAEEIYLYGIEKSADKLTLLKNYQILLTNQNRFSDADAIAERLEKIQDLSPFNWYNLAKESYENNKFRDAIRYFDRALDVAPYFHEAYLGKAQSFYQLNQNDNARSFLILAIEKANSISTRSLYEAKLTALNNN